MPIYLWEKKSQEAFSTSQTATLSEVLAMVPLNTDVTEKDRINGVNLRDGTVFSDKIYRVENVNRRGQSHLELDLKMVSS